MKVQNTVSCFYPLIILQTLFAISRLHLIDTSLKKIYKFILLAIKILYIFIIHFDGYIALAESRKIILLLFQFAISVNWLFLLLFAGGSQKFFDVLTRLDHKCGINDEYYTQVKRKVWTATIISIFFVVIDACCAWFFHIDALLYIIITISTTAYGTEFYFYGLLVDCFNLRLAKLKSLSAANGAKINRYVLLAASQLIGTFNLEVIVLLAGTLFITYISVIVVFLADPDRLPTLLSYLVWTLSKFSFLLWYVCGAAARTEAEYRELSFNVARRIVAHATGTTGENSQECKTLKRWYRFLVLKRPRFNGGNCVDLDLTVPLNMIEVIASYMLLFIQFYRAYYSE